eukprot:TRINITY_DN12890_c2_g1_i1.p1 TRINITY_DN12890_c2_g1~~TRINITY_DN12890_c2_g1_i1.p1  ORF type:complete len:880 (+),score=203.59 TRINITY_DN12890_c2_g1_i1:377-2641(+)
MTDHITSALRQALKDSDPYVRRCAATAVAKVFAINRQRMEDGGFTENLAELLSDSNPTVIAAAVCALHEIQILQGDRPGYQLQSIMKNISVSDLLQTLSDTQGCNEWGQVYVLECLAQNPAETQDKADLICSKVLPKLQHGNAAVVLTTVRIVMNYIERWGKGGGKEIEARVQAIAPPLVSLVSGGTDFEIRYVALRNISLILQRFPDLLTNQVRVFFVKYNDPIYIKLEKLDIMLQLVNASNVRGILNEFSEYAQEVDVEFVRKAVRAIGVTAIKIESAAEDCAAQLSQLIKTRVNYVVQESIIVVRDVFRKYPGRYEGLIGVLCESLETLDEPDAKAAMIWIIGEYAEKIENADELLDDFLDSFAEESVDVQLQILTAIVKLFLKRPDATQELLQKVLQTVSESDIPDLRDRGYVYWRLLSLNPTAASTVVLSEKETIDEGKGSSLDPKIVSAVLPHIGSLSSVYQKPPEAFVQNYHGKTNIHDDDDDDRGSIEEEIIEVDNDESLPQFQRQTYYGEQEPRSVWFPASSSNGVSVNGRFVAMPGHGLILDLQIVNENQLPASDFKLQVNVNSFGLTLTNLLTLSHPLASGETFEQQIRCVLNPTAIDGKNVYSIDIAFATNFGVSFATVPFNISQAFYPNCPLGKDEFLNLWRSIQNETQFAISGLDQQALDSMLQANRFCFVAKRSEDNATTGSTQDHLYYSLSTVLDYVICVEVAFDSSSPSQCMVSIHSPFEEYIPSLKHYMLSLSGQN